MWPDSPDHGSSIFLIILVHLLVGILNSPWIFQYFRPDKPGRGFFRLYDTYHPHQMPNPLQVVDFSMSENHLRWKNPRRKSTRKTQRGVSAEWIPTPPQKIKMIMRHLKYIICFHANLVDFFVCLWYLAILLNEILLISWYGRTNLWNADPWKRRFHLEAIIFRFYVHFRVCSFSTKTAGTVGFCPGNWLCLAEACDENSPMALGWRSRRWLVRCDEVGWRYISSIYGTSSIQFEVHGALP